MKNQLILAIAVLGFCACGGKKEQPEPSGPQSSEGALLDSVRKTAEDANRRTRKIEEKVAE